MPFVTSGGARIHYAVEGDGPPLVLHHGFGGSTASWHDFGYVEALAPFYRLVMLDARGHGRSDKPHDPAAYGLTNQVNDTLAVLDHLGIDRTRYYGYSMGAHVGYGLCAYAPHRLSCLAAGGFSPSGATRERQRQITTLLRRGAPAWIAALEADGPLPQDYKDRVLAADFDAYIALWEGWFAGTEGVEEAFLRFPRPRLVLMGSEDRACESAQAICGERPGVSLVVLDGLTHGTGLSRSAPALRHLLPFLAAGDGEASSGQ